MASLQSQTRLISSRGHGCSPSYRRSYQISLTWHWSTRARVTDSDQTAQRGIRTRDLLVMRQVTLTARSRALFWFPTVKKDESGYFFRTKAVESPPFYRERRRKCCIFTVREVQNIALLPRKEDESTKGGTWQCYFLTWKEDEIAGGLTGNKHDSAKKQTREGICRDLVAIMIEKGQAIAK